MPEYPDYADLQPPSYYEKFYRADLTVRTVDGVAQVTHAPRHAAMALRMLGLVDRNEVRISDGHIEFCGHVEYRVVGYHVRGKALLLELTRVAPAPPTRLPEPARSAINDALNRAAD